MIARKDEGSDEATATHPLSAMAPSPARNNSKKVALFIAIFVWGYASLSIDISSTNRFTSDVDTTQGSPHNSCWGISPISPLDPDAPTKYLVFYPRAGMGNILISYISSVMYACVTGRILKIAPYNQRELAAFTCDEYFDTDAPGSICEDLEMDEQLRLSYESSQVEIKRPEAWLDSHCDENKQYLEYFLCDDGMSNEQFTAVCSVHYWGDLLFDNPFLKNNLPAMSFRNVLRDKIAPSEKVQQKMVQDGPYHVCVHFRWGMDHTTMNLGENWIDHLGTCVRNLFQHWHSYSQPKVLLFTMHEDIRQAVKQSLESGSSENHEVVFASSDIPNWEPGGSGHSNDRYQGIADMFSMGSQCTHLLPSYKGSTFFMIAANLMENVSVFPGDQWKNGCLEGSQVTDMIPIDAYWYEGNDVCNLRESTCHVNDEGQPTATSLKPALRFFEVNNAA
jgi:hypothetical protein